MGWRTSNNYDRDQEEAWRRLPLRDRYHWKAIATLVLIILASLTVGFALRLWLN